MLRSHKEVIITSIRKIFKEGMSIEKISVCVSIGIVIGIFPVLGTTTVLCTLAAIVFRLNLPLIQIVNYAVYPLQLFLLALFYGVGNWLFNDQNSIVSDAQVVGMLQDDMSSSLALLWDMTLSAVLLWTMIGPILAVTLYILLIPVIRKLPLLRHASASGSEDLE